MVTLEITILKEKLAELRNKWKGDWPKSDLDKRWWKFKCDHTMALGLIEKIKILESGVEKIERPDEKQPIATDKIYDVAKMIFG
jgi:hypothetical protein